MYSLVGAPVDSIAVVGDADGTNSTGACLVGRTGPNGKGVFGYNTGTGPAIYGENIGTGFAGRFVGPVLVQGNLVVKGTLIKSRWLLPDRSPTRSREQVPVAFVRRVTGHEEHLRWQRHHRRDRQRHRDPRPTSRPSTATTVINSPSWASSRRRLFPGRSPRTASRFGPTSPASKFRGRSRAFARMRMRKRIQSSSRNPSRQRRRACVCFPQGSARVKRSRSALRLDPRPRRVRNNRQPQDQANRRANRRSLFAFLSLHRWREQN